MRPITFPGGLEITPIEVDAGVARLDLTLFQWDDGQVLHGRCEYATDLFDAGTMRRLLGHFQNVLEALISEPEQQLSEIALLSEAERRQLLVEWNETAREYPFGPGTVVWKVAGKRTVVYALRELSREEQLAAATAMIAAAGWFRFRELPAAEQEYSVAQLGFEVKSQAPIA